MKELAGRLAALDPDAGAALQVIAYFDRLVEGRAGLEALVRGAAVLSGGTARLVDAERCVRIRVGADGVRLGGGAPPDPRWMSAPLEPGGVPAVWLELAGPPGGVHAMVLERAAAAARVVLDRTRGRAPVQRPGEDPASVEVLLDASAPEHARRQAAGRLGLRDTVLARAVAPAGAPPVITPVPAPGARVPAEREPSVTGGRRAGIGPAVPLLGLPASWAAARVALRFTAEGDAWDPGPRTVYADDLGTLVLLADAVGAGGEPVPDVRALERAAGAAPWAALTLHAVAFAPSLRAAAAELTLHHSTLQDRLAQAEQWLGWPVQDPYGRLRLQLALMARRLHRSSGV
ncbi:MULTISPECIES: helix-turn-helix domain-containing protein [unclassified Streptomyces]|uniref:helix-turn-helix domain-containing protein n=1 Tax=unclassified Streptomyces TaxID=2593676 RepID=UPI002E79823C|nr:helix-turn-helix domain-containing protein [Streptomyces sp. JV176]MEE1800892.1 helix-turn-helix domain-containing protein [Streptomyces sp. JV176]